jgi:hypothetical protein
MENLLQQIDDQSTNQSAAAKRRAQHAAFRAIRITLTAGSGLLFIGLALSHESPLQMLVGLAPLAMIAVEAVWRLLDPRNDCR